jgi:hypothetical protein
MTTTKRVLLLGRLDAVVGDARDHLQVADVELVMATGLDDVQKAFAEGPVDHVVMGAGLALETRLEVIRTVFEASETTTVHMKDFASGPDAFLPFIQAILTGLATYNP